MDNWNIKELFYLILDFKSLTPNTKTWNEKDLKDNEPRLIRFKRIISLLQGFELINTENIRGNIVDTNEITSFLGGWFIHSKNLEYYKNIYQYLEKNKTFNYSNKIKLDDIQSFYEHLIEYRISMEKVLNFNSSIMESMGIGIEVSIKLIDKTNYELSQKIEEIDELLFLIMDPENRSFSEEELVIKYSFPKGDLDEIDIDNW